MFIQDCSSSPLAPSINGVIYWTANNCELSRADQVSVSCPMQWQPISRVDQLKSGMQRAPSSPPSEFYWLQQSFLPLQHNLVRREYCLTSTTQPKHHLLTIDTAVIPRWNEFIMEEREDTELLRELLPRFISSCSVWRLQLSVLNEFILYDRTEVVWIIYWDGWQSSYRISLNNNLKLHQYWQNTVLNGSSSYSKQTSHFDSSFLLCVLWSVSYLVLAEPHCSFLTNISFSLICFLFRLIIVISRHFLEHNMRVWECQVPANIWQTHLAQIFVRQSPGASWPGWLLLITLPAWPLPNLAWLVSPASRHSCWPRFAVDVAGRINRKYRAAGRKVWGQQQQQSASIAGCVCSPWRQQTYQVDGGEWELW